MAVYPTPLQLHPDPDLLKHYPELQRLALALEDRYASGKLVTDEMLQATGSALWQALDQNNALKEGVDRSGNQVLPIVISSNDGAIQHLPWETLYHDDGWGFLGRSERFTLSRRLDNGRAEFPDLETGPLRIVLFTSLPDNVDAYTSRLNVEEEQAQVQEALMRWIAEGKVLLEMPDDGRFESFQRLLVDFRPHLVFLSGHGKFYHQPHAEEKTHGVFLFEDDNGRSHAVKDKDLAKILIGSSVECIVLSACESGKTSSTSLTAGLARTLAIQGLPHVIGMRESLLDRAGILLARSFCDAIAHGNRVDLALQQGRRAMSLPLKDATRRDNDRNDNMNMSLGQWCLPMLFSHDPGRPLIDWNFTPQAQAALPVNKSLGDLSLPPRFIGRRSELRTIKSRLSKGQLGQLLLTGPGGQGKTALAGKLARDLQAQGYAILVYQAGPASNLNRFDVQAKRLLGIKGLELYNMLARDLENEQEKLELLLQYLIETTGNMLLLLFDNLEAIQDQESLEFSDHKVKDWIVAAQKFAGKGLVLLLTSRYRLPGWSGHDHWSLEHANYGDFLAMARQLRLPSSFFMNRDRLRRVYKVLHGNGRGLGFFAAAVASMDTREEENFLAALSQANAGTQADMSLELLIRRLTPTEQTLLQRLPAYPVPVPIEGLNKLGLDLDEPEQLIKGLRNRSLLEQRWNPDLLTREYQCPALVSNWLRQKSARPGRPFYTLAADYLVYLFRTGQHRSLDHAIVCHQALLDAGAQQQADRFALDYIVGPLNQAGLFQTLLDQWLPEICQSTDKKTRAEALGQTGKQYLHLGDYDTAFSYLKQSLEISQEIGDKSGEGATLNNISQVYKARGDYDTALSYLKQSLEISQEIGDKSGEGATLNNISQVYYARGDYDTALSYLKQSLEIRQEIGDKSGEGTTLNNISQVYKARGDYDTALSYLKQSLEISQEIGDKSGEGTTLNNISQVYKARGDYDTAFSYLKQSLEISQEIGDAAGLCAILFNIGHIHLQKEEVQEALGAWVNVYLLARQLNLAQALQALEDLAGQLGLDGGLESWQALAEKFTDQK